MSECPYAYDDGAYVLGALSPAERAGYERHLTHCLDCRAAVAELAVLPGLLGRIDPAERARIEASSAPRTGPRHPRPDPVRPAPVPVRAGRTARRGKWRGHRWWSGAALVVACIASIMTLVVVFTAVVPLGSHGEADRLDPGIQVPLVAMRPVEKGVPVSADIGVRTTDWGTEITMRCVYRSGADYSATWTFRLVARGRYGEPEQISSWLAAPGAEVTLTGTTSLSGADLVRLELVRGDGVPLLAYDLR